MTHAPIRTCPTSETLATFAEGSMKGAERAALVEHLDTCDECTHEVALGMQAVEEEDNVIRSRRWMPWISGIAAAVVIALLIPVVWQTTHRSPVARLAALTPKNARIIEPRLSGGFAWSPYHGAERASGNAVSDPERMKLAGAAGELLDRAQHDPSAGAQHDAGVAMVLTQNPVEGIARLETAAKEAPSAQTWSDLAAARYAAASDLGRAALYPQALAAADAALKLDPNLPEALFNRALIVERMGLTQEARAAWNRYLSADPSSKWADEARTHLAELPTVTKSSRFERDQGLLESSAADGNEKRVRALVAEHSARALAFAEAEYLGRWGEAVLQKNDNEAARWLTVSRNIGAAIAAESNDTLLRDAVQAIDVLPPSRRETMAAAHAAYRTGRIAYSKQKLDDARLELDRAAILFAENHSPMELPARYYRTSVQQAKNDPGVRAEFERIAVEIDAKPEYRAFRARTRWALGRARMLDYDWPGAIAAFSQGATLFHEIGDRATESSFESVLAYCLAVTGRGDESWSTRILSLRSLSAEGNAASLAAALGSAMRAERLAGRNDAALALARLPQPVEGDAAQNSLVFDALQFESMLETATGDVDGALRTARRASALAQGISDPSLRARRLADADVMTGAALTVSNASAAIAPLTRAIDYYHRNNLPFPLPEPLLLHARCALRAGDTAGAERDFEEGMEIIERHRAQAGGVLESSILDADHALFTEAVRLDLDRGENAVAFAVAERSRGAAVTLPELQERLAGSGTAVIELLVLPEEVVTFAVTENDLQIARSRMGSAAWAPLVDASLSESGTKAAASLYDVLIRPIDSVLSRARNVIIVPDPRLESVPFAALYDATTGRYLVERLGVATATSAAGLRREDARASTSVATMSLPTGGATGTAALPEAGRELSEIGSLYRRTASIAPADATFSALREAAATSDVVHIAGHTERQPAGGEHALLLAGPNGAAERVSSRAIAAMRMPHAPLIVLAACETLRPPASAETHASSLGSAFAAAGAAGTIGTLTPVGDRDARTFFRALHRHLAAGENASGALREAQLAAIHEQRNSGGSAAWRSIALLTSRIYTSKG